MLTLFANSFGQFVDPKRERERVVYVVDLDSDDSIILPCGPHKYTCIERINGNRDSVCVCGEAEGHIQQVERTKGQASLEGRRILTE